MCTVHDLHDIFIIFLHASIVDKIRYSYRTILSIVWYLVSHSPAQSIGQSIAILSTCQFHRKILKYCTSISSTKVVRPGTKIGTDVEQTLATNYNAKNQRGVNAGCRLVMSEQKVASQGVPGKAVLASCAPA